MHFFSYSVSKNYQLLMVTADTQWIHYMEYITVWNSFSRRGCYNYQLSRRGCYNSLVTLFKFYSTSCYSFKLAPDSNLCGTYISYFFWNNVLKKSLVAVVAGSYLRLVDDLIKTLSLSRLTSVMFLTTTVSKGRKRAKIKWLKLVHYYWKKKWLKQ